MNLTSKTTTLLLVAATTFASATLLAQTAARTNDAKPAAKPADAPIADAVATGKGFTITRSQLDDEIIRIKATVAAQGRQLPQEGLDPQVLERLIEVKLVLARANDADRAKGKEQADKRIADEKAKATSEESFNRQLRAIGMSQDEFAAKLAEAAIVDAVLERELKVNITDEEIKKYYDDHPARFEQPEMVRACHILFATRDPQTGAELTDDQKQAKRKQAAEIQKRAKDGEDFGKLAKMYSEDPGSKDRGGEYYFPRGVMQPEFEAAAFALGTNQVSEIVTTPFGYHIIKCIEKTPAQKMALDKATDNIRQFLKLQQMQKQLPDYMEKLKTESDVKILDDKLKMPKTESPGAAAETATETPKSAATNSPKATPGGAAK